MDKASILAQVTEIKHMHRTINKMLDENAIAAEKIGNFTRVFDAEAKSLLFESLSSDADMGIMLVRNSDCGAVMPAHQHEASQQYMIIVNGSVGLRFANGVYRILAKGECASIRPGEVHSAVSLENETKYLNVYIPADDGLSKIK